MEVTRKEETYTIDDIYNLPDGKRAELVDGQIYYMAPPGRIHQKLSMFLSNEISEYIKKNRGNCEVYAAPFAVFLDESNENYVEPDIAVICDISKLDDKGCHGAPDWVVEIVSSSSRQMDYFLKLFKYQKAGVREYWIVDPAKEQVIVYKFENEVMEQYSFGEEIAVGIYDEFVIKIQPHLCADQPSELQEE